MDPYQQYLEDIAYEDYLKKIEAEDLQASMQRSSALGPNYDLSVAENAARGVTQLPRAVTHMASDVAQFALSPIDTIQQAGAEKSLRTVGGLAGGTAGAAALAPFGAGWGSVFGPIGTIIGGALGGGAGFGAGMLGFDIAADAASSLGGENRVRPVEEYLKDFAYNTGQGSVLGGVTSAATRLPGVRRLAPGNVEGRVVEELKRMEPSLEGRLPQALEASGADPFGQYKSLGELLDSDVLKNAQRSIARGPAPEGTQGTPFGRAKTAEQLRNDAQLKYLEQIETSPTTMQDVQSSIQQGIEGRKAAQQVGLTEAEQAVGAAMSELPPPIDAQVAGNLIREGAQAGKEGIRGQVTTAFEGAGDNAVGAPILAQARAAELMPKYFREVGAQPNAELDALVRDLNRPGTTSGVLGPDGKPIVQPAVYTIRDIQALRSKALDIANSSDKRTAGVAGEIADALKMQMEEAATSGKISPEQAQSLKEGIAKRKEQGKIYESVATPTKSVLSKQPYGEFRVPDSAVPSKYFRPGERGTREAIQNYKKAVGASEEALEPIYRYATDSFRDYVVKDGKVDAGKARKWMARHKNALEELPELRRQLGNVDEAQTFLNQKYGDLQRSQAEVEKGALKQFLQVDPDKAISAMLSGRDMVKRTNSTVQYLKANDPDAVAGLRRGVIEHLKTKTFIPDAGVALEEAALPGGRTFDGTVRGGLLKSEWERIKPALERSKLFTDSQMKGFDYLYRDKSSQLSVEKAKMAGGSDTVQNASTLAAIMRAAGTGYLRNIPGGRFLSLIEPILKKIPEAKFHNLLEEALLNPRMARDLMQKATTKNFTRSAEMVFKEELAKAFETTAPGAALVAGAKTAAPFSPTVREDKKPTVPKQQAVTSKKSFPSPSELLNPPAPGKLKNATFNMKAYVAAQPMETQARIATESDLNPNAVSPKGAEGLSQLMPDTAEEIAQKLGERYMPLRPGMNDAQREASIKQNIRFGDHYYKEQLREFKNPTLAWAAYNAGPQRVRDAIAMAGTSRDVNKVLSSLPRKVQEETIPYVNEIIDRLGVSGGR